MSNKGKHVTHILLAEFDIDKGASLTYQYPEETGTDEHLLAELMLPDGAHLRAEDWTVFFLNQTIPDPEKIQTDEKQKKNKPQLLYVLNLVRTKHDTSVRRGAMVKAMAICTKHQFLHIYKPVLLLALEKYFQDSSRETLAALYESVNSMDVSNMPHLSATERAILRASENKDMFEEKFLPFENNQGENGAKGSGNADKSSTEAADEERLAKLKRGTYINLSSRELMSNLNSKNKDRHFFETSVVYNEIKLPIRVPLTVMPEEVGDFSLIKLIATFQNSSLVSNHQYHSHLDTSGSQTHPLILLLNALLTQKRIIFLGQGRPSGEVANYVLAACAMGSGGGGVLRGFTERAFPYTNLTQVDELLKVPGFIAGVTNRIFEDHSSWWDVLYNIETGKITVSKDIAMPTDEDDADDRSEDIKSPSSGKGESGKDKWDNSDNEFINEVIHNINHHYGEMAIRAKFQEYVQRFVRLAAVYEAEVIGSTTIGMAQAIDSKYASLGTGLAFPDETCKQREMAANINRIKGWRKSISYKYYEQDFKDYLKNRCIKAFDVYHQVAKLKTLKNMPEEDVETLYKAFVDNIVTDDQIIENQGGLFPVGLGLFYPRESVRAYTVELFKRISAHTTGVKFVQSLNYFQKFAFERQLASLSDTSDANSRATEQQ
ncbi:3841_t:CDS:10 [Paraglomus occultum]|uniref:3841_t:CDS:1 n=1 Tax=Paraglomus occultum TaxID=144539 RepID=A0A9N9A6B9_9GLOM|nr:3841_t:CDS:10 [Paraglomus occultum]